MKKLIQIAVIGGVFLSACGQTAMPADAPTATNTPTPAPTVTFTPIPLPTETPIPEPTAAPVPDQEALKLAWQPVVNGSILIHTICPMVVDTAVRQQAGEIDGIEAYGEILASLVLLNSIEEVYASWTPGADTAPYKEMILAHIDVMQGVLTDWTNEVITSADVIGLLEAECAVVEETGVAVIAAARLAGLTQETLETMLEELRQGFEDIELDE